MNSEKVIEIVKKEVVSKIAPTSIFTYGSYNTPEYLAETSDVEIGVIKSGGEGSTKILKAVAKKHSTKETRLRIYPYDLEKLKNQTVDSPFTKTVLIRSLILTSKTIWGERIIENLPLPPITLLDAYREASFSTMRALSIIFFLRAKRLEEAYEMAYKACLFATLSLEFLLGEFPVGFKNILITSKELDINKSQKKLISFAYGLRDGEIKPTEEEMYDYGFKIITYCNQFVEEKVKKELIGGDRVLVK